MVVAGLALFVALGGTSYAVNRINGSQIEDRSIEGRKLQRNTVRASEIREAGMKVTASVRADSAGNADALGGTAAVAHARNVDVVEANSPLSSAAKSVTASCPVGSGKLVIGGGASAESTNEPIAIRQSRPTDDRTGWTANAIEAEPTGQDWLLRAYAICANR